MMAGLLSGGLAIASPENPEPIGRELLLPPMSAQPAAALEPGPSRAILVSVVTAPRAVPAPVNGPMLGMRERAAEMVMTALDFVGVRYRRGGDSETSGFDCSGFARHVFGRLGFVLPRRVDEQASAPGLVAVSREDLRPGDLMFFNTLRRTFSHVGIYIGDNRFVHAPRPGGEVRTENMGLAYWARRYTGARRAEPSAPADENPAIAAIAPGNLGE